jgi:hypothetical protein
LDEVLAEQFDKEAQSESADEWNDELTMDEPESHIYDGTKTPCEPGDSVKFQGNEGPIRGTIVEVNKAAGNAIVKAKGYEYRVALDDIQPLNSTFKKMWANSCIRILPSEPKYAQIFNNLTKDPSIDDPWKATWDARDKDIHSGPKETKNKDVRPIVKGIGKKAKGMVGKGYNIVVTYEFTEDGWEVIAFTEESSEAVRLYNEANQTEEYTNAQDISIMHGYEDKPEEDVTEELLEYMNKYGQTHEFELGGEDETEGPKFQVGQVIKASSGGEDTGSGLDYRSVVGVIVEEGVWSPTYEGYVYYIKDLEGHKYMVSEQIASLLMVGGEPVTEEEFRTQNYKNL